MFSIEQKAKMRDEIASYLKQNPSCLTPENLENLRLLTHAKSPSASVYVSMARDNAHYNRQEKVISTLVNLMLDYEETTPIMYKHFLGKEPPQPSVPPRPVYAYAPPQQYAYNPPQPVYAPPHPEIPPPYRPPPEYKDISQKREEVKQFILRNPAKMAYVMSDLRGKFPELPVMAQINNYYLQFHYDTGNNIFFPLLLDGNMLEAVYAILDKPGYLRPYILNY